MLDYNSSNKYNKVSHSAYDYYVWDNMVTLMNMSKNLIEV